MSTPLTNSDQVVRSRHGTGAVIVYTPFAGVQHGTGEPTGRRTLSPLTQEKTTMHYKTIVLGLMEEQYPALHEQLRKERTLLSGDGPTTRQPETPPRFLDGPAELKRSRTATRSRSRARPWSWRSRTCGTICPPTHRRTDRNGSAFPGRGDGVRPQSYAARVSAARAKAGQPLLPLLLPSRQNVPPHGCTDPAAGRNRRFPLEAVLLLAFSGPRPWPFSGDVTDGAARRNRTNGFHKPCFSKE